MTDSNTETKKSISRKDGIDEAIAMEMKSQESEKEQQGVTEEGKVQSNAKHSDDRADQDTVTTKREKYAFTTRITEEEGCVPVRHPRLPASKPPLYFVNKDGVVFSNASSILRPLKVISKGFNTGSCSMRYNKKNHTFKLVEIMAYTFSEHFDRDKHYIAYKDGDRNNCAWSNLIICDDLATLQQTEIDRLQRLHPGTKYTVVRNVHDTMTFERYLVSDTGKIYSLRRGDHHHLSKGKDGYMRAHLAADTNGEQTVKRTAYLLVSRIVMESFNGSQPKDFQITYCNGDKSDNSLNNLVYADPTRTAAKKQRKKSSELVLPPITNETRWKTIGTLPWNGLSFSQLEVSDMGHVRNKSDSQLLKVSYRLDGCGHVYIRQDNQDPNTYPKRLDVARLVANAFVDGYSKAHNSVKHLNGDRLDNRAQNLKWVSMRSRPAQPVVASLVDDPKIQKEFPSTNKAERELSAYKSTAG